jgi:Pyrimidine dimer DNA glycosylase
MVTTFLPVPCFVSSAKILDRKRLNQQCNEVEWLLRALKEKSGRVYSHPCAKMWEGFETTLITYGLEMCKAMGSDNNRYFRICSYTLLFEQNVLMPPWLGLEALHSSHRGNLLRKDSAYYGKFGWTDSPLLPYYWPGRTHANTLDTVARNSGNGSTFASKQA